MAPVLLRALLRQSFPVLLAGGAGLLLAGLALEQIQVGVPGGVGCVCGGVCVRACAPSGGSA